MNNLPVRYIQTALKPFLLFFTGLFTVLFLLSQIAYSAKVSSAEVDTAESAPLIIQSQVKGSQEQPNVIYIMPWQGVEQIIEVKGKERTIKLPKFSPIHPKAFKQQVQFFANKQLAAKTEVVEIAE
ncbi:hypothetical protein [Colwellia echini]|uniref:Uncharacterized protein n=1 Tax=Colwellia echini TaxID=1982103 RepID=A0ABY3MW09_9GAMM|nr:hypothetical protein [Colwellia echini]TYK65401.1 hypothetical protein CWS31_011095 [Colwellia echini]